MDSSRPSGNALRMSQSAEACAHGAEPEELADATADLMLPSDSPLTPTDATATQDYGLSSRRSDLHADGDDFVWPDVQWEFAGTDRFRLEEKLGVGGMATVWRAYDRQREETVALKAVHYRCIRETARLKHEFRLLTSLAHPSIVAPHELHRAGAACFFTMELIDGLNWLVYVRHGFAAEHAGGSGGDSPSVAPSRALVAHRQFDRLRHTFVQLADALDYLHQRGIVHCDVKPSNVMITPEGRLVLIDFGLVFHGGNRELLGQPNPCLAGTAAYMAPELADHAKPTPAVDWYAAGVMLYEALTGRPPFQGSFHEVMAAKRTSEVPSAHHRFQTPRDLSELCQALLHPQPERRATGANIRRTLQGIVSPTAQAFPAGAGRGSTLPPDNAQFAELDAGLEQAAAGRTTVVVVPGASGSDQCCLTDAFCRRVAAQNRGLGFAGRCREAESLSCKAFDEVVDQMVGHLSQLSHPFVERLLPRDADFAALTTVFPGFACLAGQTSLRTPRELPDQELQRRGYAAFADLLSRVAMLVPIVVTLEDVQWDDAASAMLAAELLTPGDIRLLLVLGCPPEEKEKSYIVNLVYQKYACRCISARSLSSVNPHKGW